MGWIVEGLKGECSGKCAGRVWAALFPFTEYLGFNFNGDLGNKVTHLLNHDQDTGFKFHLYA